MLRQRAVPDGTPVFLNEDTMLPSEPLCSWFLHLAYDGKAAKTMREYAYIVLRLAGFLRERGCDLLSARESDLRAYRDVRTRLQERPVGDSMWGKEAQLINQLYRWLVDYGHLRSGPLRVGGRGRVPMAPRLRRSMDIRHMTLGQYRFFRDVGLGGLLPDSRCDDGFRGRAPHRGRAAADLALSTGMRPQEWRTLLLPELGGDTRRPGEPAVFTAQACAKYGKRREVFVPSAARIRLPGAGRRAGRWPGTPPDDHGEPAAPGGDRRGTVAEGTALRPCHPHPRGLALAPACRLGNQPRTARAAGRLGHRRRHRHTRSSAGH
jgi:hypothetical protein